MKCDTSCSIATVLKFFADATYAVGGERTAVLSHLLVALMNAMSSGKFLVSRCGERTGLWDVGLLCFQPGARGSSTGLFFGCASRALLFLACEERHWV